MIGLSLILLRRCSIQTILLMGCLAMQGACDKRTYGISRGVNLSRFPDSRCIESVLREMRELLVVERVDPPESKDFQRFRYRGHGFWAHLSVQVELDGKVLFGHDHLMVDERPKQNEISETRRIMILVEQRLSVGCAMPELKSGVVERLHNV